jgi:hypothetical protein
MKHVQLPPSNRMNRSPSDLRWDFTCIKKLSNSIVCKAKNRHNKIYHRKVYPSTVSHLLSIPTSLTVLDCHRPSPENVCDCPSSGPALLIFHSEGFQRTSQLNTDHFRSGFDFTYRDHSIASIKFLFLQLNITIQRLNLTQFRIGL